MKSLKMNPGHEDNKQAYLEKLSERLGSTTTFEILLRCEYGSEAMIIEDFMSGKLKVTGHSAAITLCERRFEVEQNSELNDNNEAEE